MHSEDNILTPLLEEHHWPTPLPLCIEKEATPYPVEALPFLVRDAVIAYQRYGQQPLPLVACSALAGISLAAQAMANVARDSNLISPVSLYFLVIATSGERKSAADQTFIQPLRQWENDRKEKMATKVEIANTLHQAWRAEKNGLLQQIRRSALDDENSDYLKMQLIELLSEEPDIPLLPTLFFEDVTQEALAFHLARHWPSVALWSDEGGIVLSSHSMQQNATKFVTTLNRLWDGNAFRAHRKTTASSTIAHRRLTLNLMLQPLILQQMLTKQDGIIRHSGFLPRCLIAYPSTAMGNRYYQEPPQKAPAMTRFHARLIECLNQSLSLDRSGCKAIPILTLSSRAKNAWVAFFNQMERGLNHEQWFAIADFASKAAENVARLAALFHLFEGATGQIHEDTLERATHIISWHLQEALRLLVKADPPKVHQQAIQLLEWIKSNGLTETSPRYLQQYGPVRDKKARNSALQILIEHGYLRETTRGKSTQLQINSLLYKMKQDICDY